MLDQTRAPLIEVLVARQPATLHWALLLAVVVAVVVVVVPLEVEVVAVAAALVVWVVGPEVVGLLWGRLLLLLPSLVEVHRGLQAIPVVAAAAVALVAIDGVPVALP